MMTYPVHSIDTAPEASKPLLRGLEQALGVIPNLAAAMAESPQLLKSFLAVREIYRSGTLTLQEIEVLSLTAAFENGCAWCMSFHTALARKEGIAEESIESLRAGQSPQQPRLGALSDLARELIRNRGAASPEVLDRFHGAGYSRAQALEVVLGIAFSLMANFSGHLTDAPLNEFQKACAWKKAAA